MKNMEVKIIWTFGVLIFLKGCLNRQIRDEHVTIVDNVMGWEGSCVMLPCEYTKKHILKFIWYYNATYDDKQRYFNGEIVYDSMDTNNVSKLFAGHVQHLPKNDKDCTIIIKDIKKAHEGDYRVRLLPISGDFKWMSKNNVFIKVSDTGSSLQIQPVPEIRALQSITLTCSIRDYCPLMGIDLSWIGDISGTNKTEVSQGINDVITSNSVTFRPSWSDHQKNVTCVLKHNNKEAEKKTVQLNVMYAPQNVQVLPNTRINITESQPLNLTCTVESSNPPDYEITWFKDNKPQRQDPKKGDAYQLQVFSSGKYFCEAKNIIGKSTSNLVNVSLLYPPRKPVIKNVSQVIEGMDIKLECSTNANPPAFRYVWYKDGEEFYNHPSKSYTISKIKEGDSGSYSCLARNELGAKESDELSLNVMYAPRDPRIVLELNGTTFAEVDKITFVEGDKVTFQCNANSSNPAINEITWYKDSKTIKNVNQVIHEKDAGKYTCEARNSVGRTASPIVNVDVLYSPKDVEIEVPSNNYIKEHQTIRLRCHSRTSKPKIKRYDWYKDDVLLNSSTSDVMELRLEWTHTGGYTCKALNDIGSGVSRKKKVNVYYAPKNVTLTISTESRVSEFMDVKLTCTGKGNPAELSYMFYVNNAQLKSSSRDTLHLKDVQIKDTGEYSCLATNFLGDGRSNVVSLHVSYSVATIVKIASIWVSSFIILLILIILIVRFRVSIRNKLCRKTVDDNIDSSFFVLKKSRESSAITGHQMASRHSSTDQLNYTNANVPVPSMRRNNFTSDVTDNEVTTVYSVVKKVPSAAEYENIDPTEMAHEDSQDEIHYSVIANLNKMAAERDRDPEVEYAKLRHS